MANDFTYTMLHKDSIGAVCSHYPGTHSLVYGTDYYMIDSGASCDMENDHVNIYNAVLAHTYLQIDIDFMKDVMATVQAEIDSQAAGTVAIEALGEGATDAQKQTAYDSAYAGAYNGAYDTAYLSSVPDFANLTHRMASEWVEDKGII